MRSEKFSGTHSVSEKSGNFNSVLLLQRFQNNSKFLRGFQSMSLMIPEIARDGQRSTFFQVETTGYQERGGQMGFAHKLQEKELDPGTPLLTKTKS